MLQNFKRADPIALSKSFAIPTSTLWFGNTFCLVVCVLHFQIFHWRTLLFVTLTRTFMMCLDQLVNANW